MARLTCELAVNNVGNRYDLVLIASRRTRELRSGWAPKIQSKNGALVTAIREIEQGFIGRDYLLKPQQIDKRDRPRSNDL
jgi:DNA-directed RNA polymerase subunit omega